MRKQLTQTITIVIGPDYRINYRRGDGYQAIIDSTQSSLGWFETQTDAQAAIDNYHYEDLSACGGFGCVDGCGDCMQVAA